MSAETEATAQNQRPDLDALGIDAVEDIGPRIGPVAVEAYDAMRAYLADPYKSFVRVKYIADDVPSANTSSCIGNALRELEARGIVERAHGSNSVRWRFVDDLGQEVEA